MDSVVGAFRIEGLYLPAGAAAFRQFMDAALREAARNDYA
jgi:hypothetical protein